MQVHLGARCVEWFTELQPLERKDGATIATALVATVKELLETCGRAVKPVGNNLRAVHLVTGDAVNTNDNAMRRMLGHFRSRSCDRSMEYFLVVWRCASHQINLVVAVAICREILPKPVEQSPICGACVRLYKYLVPDYCEESASNLRRHVADHMRVVSRAMVEQGAWERCEYLVALYGNGVVPVDLRAVLSGDVTALECIAEEGADYAALDAIVYRLLYKYVLMLEEKPVVTLLWLFINCVYGLLRMQILGLPSTIFTLRTTSPKQENQKRLVAFKKFYDDPQTPALLRQAAICLRLTEHALNLTAKKPSKGPPTLVRLGRGDVQHMVSADISAMVPLLRADPTISLRDTIVGILATGAHIIIRFKQYLEYPTKVWRMVQIYNPTGFAASIEEFVETPVQELDVGYSLPLQQAALAKGSIAAAISHMMIARVQLEMQNVLAKGSCTSLDVERKNNQDKQADTTKVTGVARASRNSILQR